MASAWASVKVSVEAAQGDDTSDRLCTTLVLLFNSMNDRDIHSIATAVA
jgi:hypothetical protein